VTLTVIDVGCAKYDGDESIPYLLEEFKPDVLIGFDPMVGPLIENNNEDRVTKVLLYPWIAWLYDGHVGFVQAGLSSHVDEFFAPDHPCIDLRRVVSEIDGEIILKMDAEQSEYKLLPALREDDLDLRIKLLWIEWHCQECGRGANLHVPNCSEPVNTAKQEILSSWRGETAEWSR
jgi:hypothetical protein